MTVSLKEIFDLKKQKEKIDSDIASLQQESKTIDAKIEELNAILLSELTEMEATEYAEGDFVAAKFSRQNVGYKNEADVINYLKNNLNSQYIKTKITESIDKVALKKALKSDTTLSEALDDMMYTTATEYVVVTDIENYKKMLEHINGQ